MKFGIKVGYKDWEEKLLGSKVKIPVCEVAYNKEHQDELKPLYLYLKKNNIYAGIHVPFVCGEDYAMNLSSGNENVRMWTAKVIKGIIDEASEARLSYVNCHAGSLRDYKVIKERVILEKAVFKEEKALERLEQGTQELTGYAREKDVLLTIENSPSMEWRKFDFFDNDVRCNPLDVKFIRSDVLYKTLEGKASFCLDVGHLFTEYYKDTDDWFLKFYQAIQRFIPVTKLFHFSTVKPPFNGTDSHDGFTGEDFAKGARPSKDEMKKILKLIDQLNTNIPIVLEPKPDQMIPNFQAIRAIYDQVE